MEEILIQFAANMITTYLGEHPNAADTLEGVHQWWIRWPDNLPESIQITAAALVRLEQTQFIEKYAAGNRTIWRQARPSIN